MKAFVDVVAVLEESTPFQAWKKDHEDYYLAHGFFIGDEEWQVGYSDGHNVVVFHTDPIQALPQDEAYKKPETKVQPLPKEAITLSLSEARKVFQAVVEEHYSAEQVTQNFVLLQCFDEVVYNITAMTQSLKAINVRITMDGKVKEQSMQSLVEDVV